MIVDFIAVAKREADVDKPERWEVAFVDRRGCSWFVYWPVNATADEILRALSGAALIAGDAEKAVKVGIITRAAVDANNDALRRRQLTASMTPKREM